MSVWTLQQLEQEVRFLCRDRNMRDTVHDSESILSALKRAVLFVSGRTNNAPALVTSFLSVTLGNYGPYTVPTYGDLQGVGGFRRQSDGLPVIRTDLPVLLSHRTGSTVDTGKVIEIAFDESQSAGVALLLAYVHPVPDSADVIEGLVRTTTVITDSFLSSGAGLWATQVDLPGHCKEAVTYHAAADLINGLSLDAAKMIGSAKINFRSNRLLSAILGQSAAQAYSQASEQFLQLEKKRQDQMRRTVVPVVTANY